MTDYRLLFKHLIAVIILFIFISHVTNAQWPNFAARHQHSNAGGDKLQASLYAPTLKARKLYGYLPTNAGRGTVVRVMPSADSEPLQILVEDRDLLRGMEPAIYQYILTGYGAEKFAVNEHGTLYFNANRASHSFSADSEQLSSTSSADRRQFVLNIMAREVGTTPTRSSEPISLRVRVTDEDYERGAVTEIKFPRKLYIVNVSLSTNIVNAGAEYPVIRVAADGVALAYRLAEAHRSVDGVNAISAFRYDLTTNELRVNNAIVPGLYEVTLEAYDAAMRMARTKIAVYVYDTFANNRNENEMLRVNALTSPPTALFPIASPLLPNALSSAELWAVEFDKTQKKQLQSHQLQKSQSMAFIPIFYTTTPSINTFQQQLAPPMTFNRRIPIQDGSVDRLFGTIINKTGNMESEVGRQTAHQVIKVELSESSPPNTIVAVLGDEEAVGRYYFLMIGGNERQHFNIDSNFGIVTTAAPLDREDVPLYNLKIETHSRLPDQPLYWTTLQLPVMDENDNSPQFYGSQPIDVNVQIDEQMARAEDVFLARIHVDDADADENGRVSLRVLPPMNGLYAIADDGTLTVNGALTAAHFGEHRLAVIAEDHGQPAPRNSRAEVIVHIDRVNRSNSSGSKRHNVGANHSTAVIGTHTLTTAMFSRATLPPPGEASPLLLHSVGEHQTESAPLFTRIDTPSLFGSTSVVTSATPISTNLLKNATIMSGISGGAVFNRLSGVPQVDKIITGTVGRLAPVFTVTMLSLLVEENAEDLELCTLEAKYPEDISTSATDLPVIIYVLESGDSTLFQLNPSSGRLTLAAPLDAERQQLYNIRVGTAQSQSTNVWGFVRADDRSQRLAHSATVTVQVRDINDYIPRFEHDEYVFRIPKTQTPGTTIGQVIAYDQDAAAPNNKLIYRFNGSDDDGGAPGASRFFKIDPTTGLLKLTHDLRGEFNDDYNVDVKGTSIKIVLNVEAMDGGTPSQIAHAKAIIQVGIQSDDKEKATIIKNSITSANQLSLNGGFIKLNTVGSDHVYFSSRSYSATINEGVHPPALVFRLPIHIDVDVLDSVLPRFVQCALQSGNVRGAFSVSPIVSASNLLNGNGSKVACELRTQIQLDRELIERYQLNVTLETAAYRDHALVDVLVTDRNDNSPRFVPLEQKRGTEASVSSISEYFGIVRSLAPPDTVVMVVRAEDVDLGTNGAVRYELDSLSADSRYFSIGAENGTLYTRRKMPNIANSATTISSLQSLFDFRVVACDRAVVPDKQLCTKVRVLINVVGRAHRFVMLLRTSVNATALLRDDQLYNYYSEIVSALRPLLGACGEVRVEDIRELTNTSSTLSLKRACRNSDAATTTPAKQRTLRVNLFAVDPIAKRVCLAQEFRRLFGVASSDAVATKLKRWATLVELRRDLEFAGNDDNTDIVDEEANSSSVTANEVLMSRILTYVDWRSPSGISLLALFGVLLLVACALCVLQSARHSSCGCLFDASSGDCGKNHRYTASIMGGGDLYPPIYPIPKYGGVGDINNTIYLPSMANDGSGINGNGGLSSVAATLGTIERTKFYETQMLEFPISDEDFTLLKRINGDGSVSDAGGSPSSVWSRSAMGSSGRGSSGGLLPHLHTTQSGVIIGIHHQRYQHFHHQHNHNNNHATQYISNQSHQQLGVGSSGYTTTLSNVGGGNTSEVCGNGSGIQQCVAVKLDDDSRRRRFEVGTSRESGHPFDDEEGDALANEVLAEDRRAAAYSHHNASKYLF